MQAVPDTFEHALDAAEFKRPAHRPGVELYRAHIVRHAFEPHTHEAFGLGAIESGVERFRYRGEEHLAPADTLVLMNPDELHTGRAETSAGWRYRMVYIDAQVLEQLTGERSWWFADAVGRDTLRARRVSLLLRQLWFAREPLAFDGLLLELVHELRPVARIAQPARDEGLSRFAPVVEHLREHLAERVTLDELAALAGLSPFHFQRQFKRAHHATPQQLLMALRLFEAKRLLAAGEAPAQVAAAVGLADQAHLTHAFARRYGVTPARYQQQLGTRPPREAQATLPASC
ncbi:AraC family transcriptional regulator [Rhizobacter sp. AJA081-3]|uniref:AraC family transcriptional regulator n=1 Tax=Rhizobacter sp. AJA081-3 TaxID=2753607 RepID=UPI001AE0DDFB|nr:AraC family transcriptional regulator [Rhizobacter sp. AJA081-3]QTN23364.1 AraC family transcriptional regulator [Rhizobacter sp. AJA081-3]